MAKVKYILFLLIIILATTESAFSTIIRVPQDFQKIQLAINNAFSGDTILVSPGVYSENIDFIGKDLVIASYLIITDSAKYVTNTVIRVDTGSIVTFSNGETRGAMLIGFTLNDGWGKKHLDGEYGGAIFIKNASPIIRNNFIGRNIAGNGACVGRGGAIAIKDFSNPLIIRNTITNNRASGPCLHAIYEGGGIWIDSTSNPVIGGNINDANNIYDNQSSSGNQMFRSGAGQQIDATYNYFGTCPPDAFEVTPKSQFNVLNCLTEPVNIPDEIKNVIPSDFILYQNYPNPFNSKTVLKYFLNNSQQICVKVYDVFGREVITLINERKQAGIGEISWNAENISSGVYFIQMIAGKYLATQKAILIK